MTAHFNNLVMDPSSINFSPSLEIGGGGTVVFDGTTTINTGATFNTNGGNLTLGVITSTSSTGIEKTGSGTLVISGAPQYSGNTTVTAGKLIYDVATGSPVVGVGSTLTIAAGATVEAKGAVDPFTSGTTHTIVANDGEFHAIAGTKKVASISGTGTTTVDSSLVTESIIQDTLIIGAGGSVTIAASVPFAAHQAAEAVPEPGTWVLIGTALLGWLALRRRNRGQC